MSPSFSVLTSSFAVENCPLRTASRLTALPAIMFFHSPSGNSGQSGEFVRDRLVVLGSILKSSRSSRVRARFLDNSRVPMSLETAQGKAFSSTFSFLTRISSSDSSSVSSDSGETARRFPLYILPLPEANSTSASWFSIVHCTGRGIPVGFARVKATGTGTGCHI
jgi:hypothetical protein